MRSLLRLTVTTAAAVAIVVAALASVADARTFRMNGTWIQQRGPNVQIPIFGGIKAGNTLIAAEGSAPADMTVPVNAFTGMNDFRFPLPQTTLVQLSTMFTFDGPTAAGAFSGGPKGTRPVNFGWCPGAAANPGCVTPALGGNQGTVHGLVTYTAGANQFGGTMQMLISGTGSVSSIVASAPIAIQHNTIAGGGVLPQVQGGTFANSNNAILPGGPITTGAVCAGGTCGLAGSITIPGTQTATGTNSTNTRWGFPWTTGMVSAIATQMLPATNSTLTASGSDARTALGEGQITLVAGGLSFRNPANTTFSATDTVTMTLKAQNVPSVSPAGLAALAGLLVAGTGYAARRRFTR